MSNKSSSIFQKGATFVRVYFHYSRAGNGRVGEEKITSLFWGSGKGSQVSLVGWLGWGNRGVSGKSKSSRTCRHMCVCASICPQSSGLAVYCVVHPLAIQLRYGIRLFRDVHSIFSERYEN